LHIWQRRLVSELNVPDSLSEQDTVRCMVIIAAGCPSPFLSQFRFLTIPQQIIFLTTFVPSFRPIVSSRTA
jgi:hypothetical protein